MWCHFLPNIMDFSPWFSPVLVAPGYDFFPGLLAVKYEQEK
jgi:hypothetical protein